MTDYEATESNLYKQFSELMAQYNMLKGKRNDLLAVKQPKVSRKEELLKGKLECTLSASESLELNHIEDEERVSNIRLEGINVVRSKADRDIEAIREKAERDIQNIERALELKIQFYESQASQMTKKMNQTYNTKKATLERRENIVVKEQEFLQTNKTTAEYSNERSIQKLLKEMNNVIKTIKISREQILSSGYFKPKATPLPILPEPFDMTSPIIVTEQRRCPCGAKCPEIPEKKGSNYLIWKCLYEEGQANRRMREETLNEETRRDREEEEKREQDKIIYMQQLKEKHEAEIRRQDERRRQELEDREKEQEESELTQPIKIQQSPLTPFQGLPPPDVQRAKNPVKMVKTSLGTYPTKMYATPIEIT